MLRLLAMGKHPSTCTCARCGASTVLLDFGYQLPDCIWDQAPAERSPNNTGDFAELGQRRFVRGLLPIRIKDGEEFRYGVWLEVDEATFVEVRGSWNDKVRYPKLRFKAKLANAAPPWRQTLLGLSVDIGVREQKSRPVVIGADDAWLRKLLDDGWAQADYEAAVASFK
jgi:hypothetical protein